jgi:hypothetical protein
VRPFVETSAPQPTDKLFLTPKGCPNTRLGRVVTDFFAARGKKISVTTIRKLIETRANEFLKKNIISVCLPYYLFYFLYFLVLFILIFFPLIKM